MSEYQHVAFRAVDRPVSGKNLEYMQKQSTRAEITPWSFENEYHYGDFRGNAVEMLRRGYDVHLHYANFGVRRLMIRLPHGLPDRAAAKPYLSKEGVKLTDDKSGPGCILCIEPYYESGSLDDLWDIDELFDSLVPLRSELIDGDLRPLYLAHLAVSCDCEHDPEETVEAPVPAGLDKLTPAQMALCACYGLSDALVEAAAKGAPSQRERHDANVPLAAWLEERPAATKDGWLLDWLSDPQSSARADVLAQFRKERPVQLWPTARLDRTISMLSQSATEIARQAKSRADAKAARSREKQLAAMKDDPQPILRKAEKLVKQRGSTAYAEIAQQLADLREALQNTPQAGLAEQQAMKLRRENPTLHLLIGALRKKGFLPK